MTPAGRLAAAIEILEQAEAEPGRLDRVMSRYFRGRRYAGSGDRAAVTARVWRVVRSRCRLDWWAGKLGEDVSARTRVLADLALVDGLDSTTATPLFAGTPHAPSPPSHGERRLLDRLCGTGPGHPDMPAPVRAECPDWIASRLEPVLGDRFAACMAALGREAGLDLRINPLNGTGRFAVRRRLERAGIVTRPTPWSPLGLRCDGRPRVRGIAALRDGLVEIQDEGAQLAALLTGVEPGMQVADFCAGAGGKTLVLGALMRNRGRVLALDVSAARLERAAARVARAGLHNVERRVLGGDADRYTRRHRGRFDRVLVDAPCTGIGAWRRTPDARHRYGEADLAGILATQDAILARAARLTRPGGRLIYVTCSLLAEENEERVAALLQRRCDYRVLPVGDVWSATVAARGGGVLPRAGADMLRLDPDGFGTDGFFVAVLERRADALAST